MSKCKYRNVCEYYNEYCELCSKIDEETRKKMCEFYPIFSDFTVVYYGKKISQGQANGVQGKRHS